MFSHISETVKDSSPIINILSEAMYLQKTDAPRRCWEEIQNEDSLTVDAFTNSFGGRKAGIAALRLLHVYIYGGEPTAVYPTPIPDDSVLPPSLASSHARPTSLRRRLSVPLAAELWSSHFSAIC